MNKALLLSLSLVTLTFAAPVALASESGTHACTTTVGLSVGANDVGFGASVPVTEGVNLGGCSLVVISDTHEVTAVNPADGCSVSVDVDGDGLGDANPAVGDVYDAGSNFFVTCDLGVLDAESTLTLA